MTELEKLLEQEIHKVTNSIINKLEFENEMDDSCLNDVGMNYDFYEGTIKGRTEAINLIKKAFRMEEL